MVARRTLASLLAPLARQAEEERGERYLRLLAGVDEESGLWSEWRLWRPLVQEAVDRGHLAVVDDRHLRLTDEGRGHLNTPPTTDVIRQMKRSVGT